MKRIASAHYIRISKAYARRHYNAGNDLYFCPVNLNPESPWGLLYEPGDRSISFDVHVSLFEAYNCTSTETGRYTAFYIPNAEGART